MNIFSINKLIDGVCLKTIYRFVNVPVLRIDAILNRRRVYLFGFRIISLEIKNLKRSARDVAKKINLITGSSSITCWFDHMLGGGGRMLTP